MRTSDKERREVAEKLRELNADDFGDGKFYARGEVEITLGLLTDGGARYGANGVRHLADLIEPEERTCRMVEVKTGEVADYRDTDEIIFHCKSCHTERGIFSYDEDGNVYSARPEYCPNCGARVTDEEENDG